LRDISSVLGVRVVPTMNGTGASNSCLALSGSTGTSIPAHEKGFNSDASATHVADTIPAPQCSPQIISDFSSNKSERALTITGEGREKSNTAVDHSSDNGTLAVLIGVIPALVVVHVTAVLVGEDDSISSELLFSDLDSGC
jgi:hypothetical protein